MQKRLIEYPPEPMHVKAGRAGNLSRSEKMLRDTSTGRAPARARITGGQDLT
ncbi:MAG TPA: hypothetical protein VKC34_15040 [Blastocatellia bacterium]|nr:hypothetical protein [Blastocatellia bacterium]